MEYIKEEVWKSVIYDGKSTKYEISNYGNLREVINDFGRIVIIDRSKRQHIRVSTKKSIKKDFLVAMAFLPKPEHNNKTVFHKDGNVKNCHMDNLTWMT